MDLQLTGKRAIVTGGSRGKTHMVYLSGVADHKIDDDRLMDHIVELVEAKVASIKAAEAVEPAMAK